MQTIHTFANFCSLLYDRFRQLIVYLGQKHGPSHRYFKPRLPNSLHPIRSKVFCLSFCFATPRKQWISTSRAPMQEIRTVRHVTNCHQRLPRSTFNPQPQSLPHPSFPLAAIINSLYPGPRHCLFTTTTTTTRKAI